MEKKEFTAEERFKFELDINGIELERILAALHYWKDDSPEIDKVFKQIQEVNGFTYVAGSEREEWERSNG